MTEWLVIPRWDEFQTSPSRRPKDGHMDWIRVYTRLLSDDNYLDLTAHQRGVLHGLWLEYARARSQLRLSTRSLSARLNLRVMRRDIEALERAGFVEIRVHG